VEAASIDGQRSSHVPRDLWPELDDDLIGGVHLLASGRGWSVPIQENAELGRGLSFGAGPERLPSTFFHFFCSFLFLFFCFLIYFITFTKLIQINSNHFLNSSENQHNIL
jgi:hypothetical protein